MTSSAVVVGGGIAGIAAAAALRRAGRTVVIIEQAAPSDPGAPRRGAPQDHQLHNLLTCAQVHLERLLPGFCDEMRRAGAGSARVASQTHVFEFGVQMPRRDLDMRLMCAPRPVVERVARRLLLRDPGVTLLEGVRATIVDVALDGTVAGVKVDGTGSPASRALAADLVVDATGTRAAGRRWLRALDLEQPVPDVLAIDRWYVSSEFVRPAERLGEDEAWMIFPTAPGTRGGLISPMGSDRWCVSLSGGGSDTPPRTVDEMRAYAATLDAPWVHEALTTARPSRPPHLFRKRISVRWRYESIDRPLPGLLPIGDALASLNPLFGQGMSVAARQATGLMRLLEARGSTKAELTRAYLAEAASVCEQAWSLGELLDAPEPDSLGRALRSDAELHRRYVAAWHLMEPASAVQLVAGGDR